MKPRMRVGIGYDIHPLELGGVLTLGGLVISADRGYAPRHDHDVLLHSLIDALAGALCLGDMSDFLPDSSNGDTSSGDPLATLTGLIRDAGYMIANVDCNVIAGPIILRPFVQAITFTISRRLGVNSQQVSVKGRSNSGFREEGAGMAISSHAAVCLQVNRGVTRLSRLMAGQVS